MKPGELSQLRVERRALERKHQELFLQAAALFHRFDPIRLGVDVPEDEFEPEVGTILPRLALCRSAAEVQDVVHEEFCRWFSPEVAGSRQQYTGVSVALWKLWQREHPTGRDA